MIYNIIYYTYYVLQTIKCKIKNKKVEYRICVVIHQLILQIIYTKYRNSNFYNLIQLNSELISCELSECMYRCTRILL